MKLIFILNGIAEHGKNTFQETIREEITKRPIKANSYYFSTITPYKTIGKMIGWDGGKDEESRNFLSNLKLLSSQYNNYPVTYITKMVGRINDIVPSIIFIDSREIKEISHFKEIFNNSERELVCKTIHITRPSLINNIPQNHGDIEASRTDYEYDYKFECEYLDELKSTAIDFYKTEIVKKYLYWAQ